MRLVPNTPARRVAVATAIGAALAFGASTQAVAADLGADPLTGPVTRDATDQVESLTRDGVGPAVDGLGNLSLYPLSHGGFDPLSNTVRTTGDVPASSAQLTGPLAEGGSTYDVLDYLLGGMLAG